MADAWAKLMRNRAARRAFDQPLWIVGCAQNCAGALPSVLANLEGLRSRFQQSHVLVVENDSTDATQEVLRDHWDKHHHCTAMAFPGLNARIPAKTVRLAHLRNAATAWLRQQGAFLQRGLVLVLDMDEVNRAPWDPKAFADVLTWFEGKPRAAAVFANQRAPYYDLWALRHPKLCPDDLWEAVHQRKLEQGHLSDAELVGEVVASRQFVLNPKAKPVPVESAFGGLGFYKTQWLAEAPFPYCGETTRLILSDQQPPQLLRWQVAEHVAFHAGLRALGAKLWIHPHLLNGASLTASAEPIAWNPQSWRHLGF